MLGLIGPATVIGSLMYGVGLCWQQDLEFHYQHKELGGDMDDEQMVQQLKAAGPCSELPPLALAEVVHLSDEEFQVPLQASVQSKVIGILWKVGGNRRRRSNGSCCSAASSTSGLLLFEHELFDCHNTYELTLIRIRLGKT